MHVYVNVCKQKMYIICMYTRMYVISMYMRMNTFKPVRCLAL